MRKLLLCLLALPLFCAAAATSIVLQPGDVLTVTAASGPNPPDPTPVPVCSIAQTPANPVPVSTPSVTLSAHCSNSPLGYRWSTGATTQAIGVAAQNATYSVTAENTAGTGPAAVASVLVQSASGCAGLRTLNYDVPWKSTNAETRIITHGFDASSVVVLRFTVPAAYQSTQLSRITGVEYGGGPVTRYATVSTSACDFSSPLPPQNISTDTGTAQFWFQIGGASSRFVIVQPGQTYFMNVRNTDAQGRSTCTTQALCDMAFQVTVPTSSAAALRAKPKPRPQ